jgi:hypothetical protein
VEGEAKGERVGEAGAEEVGEAEGVAGAEVEEVEEGSTSMLIPISFTSTHPIEGPQEPHLWV